ncbi:MAG TPA: hypothetical protein DIV40_05945 [Clostridiales bacterium]|nr:hypothetical protein [Clostridiales bacterium]
MACEICQNECEWSCQTSCEISSQCGSCETACQTTCEIQYQSGQNPAENAVLTISDVDYTYFKATISGINNQTGDVLHTQFFLDGEFKTGFLTTTVTSFDYTYTGLSSGTTYAVKVTIENQRTGQLYRTFTRSVTTDEPQLPKLPAPTLDISKTVKTATTIKVTINFQDGVNKHYFRINGGATIDNGVFTTYTFTDLTPNTQYYIEIKVGGNGYQDSDWAGYYATTLSAELWEWWTPKDDENSDVSPDEWLAFCSKINEVRVAKGLSAYSFTTSSTYIGKDKPFYAWIWLQAANAINEINGQVAADCLNVKSFLESMNNDSIVYPWYWGNLKTALNNAIN